jgi:hypothetical protein
VLSSNADTALQPTGIVYLPVKHANRSQSAPEEAARILALRDSLLQQSWVDSEGQTKPITDADILIVAPFNAQKRELQRLLGRQARIGTVDKFQGQEAAVAIVSMTTSDSDNMVRGVDFLFSKNRLNVAVSRAKCLAIMVASPGLHWVECKRVEDMPLLNFYAYLTADRIESSVQPSRNHFNKGFKMDIIYTYKECTRENLAPGTSDAVWQCVSILIKYIHDLKVDFIVVKSHRNPGRLVFRSNSTSNNLITI